MLRKFSYRTLLVLSLVGLVTGCLDLTGLGDMFGRLVAIEVTPEVSNAGIVAVGDTIRVTARGRVDGVIGILAYDRVLDAVWRSSDPTVAQVSRSAVRRDSLAGPPESSEMIVRGIRPGTAHITVSARGVVGDTLVRVVAGELSPRR